jgi:hypothetical protein
MLKKLLFVFLFFTISISFSQEKSIEKLSAAPNPFSNATIITFHSESDSKTILTVKNILGKVVYQKSVETIKGNNSLTFLKGDLTAGIYIYTIQNKENNISKRLVIQ